MKCYFPQNLLYILFKGDVHCWVSMVWIILVFFNCLICYFCSNSSLMKNVIRSSKMSPKMNIFFVFWHFLLGYYLSLNLVKFPWGLGNWLSRNCILSVCKKQWKTNKLYALFGHIFKLIFASSNLFCLIASQMFSYLVKWWKEINLENEKDE